MKSKDALERPDTSDSDTEECQLPMYRVTVVYDEPADKEAFRYTDEHVPLVKAVPGLRSFQPTQGGTPYLVAELMQYGDGHDGLRRGGWAAHVA